MQHRIAKEENNVQYCTTVCSMLLASQDSVMMYLNPSSTNMARLLSQAVCKAALQPPMSLRDCREDPRGMAADFHRTRPNPLRGCRGSTSCPFQSSSPTLICRSLRLCVRLATLTKTEDRVVYHSTHCPHCSHHVLACILSIPRF